MKMRNNLLKRLEALEVQGGRTKRMVAFLNEMKSIKSEEELNNLLFSFTIAELEWFLKYAKINGFCVNDVFDDGDQLASET